MQHFIDLRERKDPRALAISYARLRLWPKCSVHATCSSKVRTLTPFYRCCFPQRGTYYAILVLRKKSHVFPPGFRGLLAIVGGGKPLHPQHTESHATRKNRNSPVLGPGSGFRRKNRGGEVKFYGRHSSFLGPSAARLAQLVRPLSNERRSIPTSPQSPLRCLSPSATPLAVFPVQCSPESGNGVECGCHRLLRSCCDGR